MSGRKPRVLAAALVLAFAADYLLLSGEQHGEFWWSGIVAFFALFGLVGCLALVGFAKALGHFWLERGEDYYGSGDRDG